MTKEDSGSSFDPPTTAKAVGSSFANLQGR